MGAFTFIFFLMMVTFLFWIGFSISGALLTAAIWMFIKLPIGLMLVVFGLMICCTIILIPIGVGFISMGSRMIIPGGTI